MDPCCQDTGRTGLLSPTEWAAPLHRSCGPGTLSREYIRRGRCPSGWGRLGGCTPARGAFGAGLLEGAGLQSPPSGSLFSREIFSLFLPIVQSPHPQNAAPRSFPRGRSFFPYVFKRGGPLGHHRPGIVSCLWNGWEDGAGRSDPELASGRDRVSSPCHTSRVVG